MPKIKKWSEARQRNARDKVLGGYRTRFRLRKHEAENLHMFFSPYRLPKGLTKEEVRIVLTLFPLLQTYRRKEEDGVLFPEELLPVGRMTRHNFRKGVEKLIRTVAA